MPRFFASVRARLLLLMLLPTAALISLTIYYQIDQRETQEASAREQLTAQAAVVAQARHQSYNSTETVMTQMTGLPEISGAASEPESLAARSACQRRLGTTSSSLSPAINFGLFDPAGERICSSQSDVRGGLSVGDRIDFQTALTTKSFAIGEVTDTRLEPIHPIMTVSMPVLSESGDVLAILRLGSDVDASTPLLLPADAPAESELMVVDHNGRSIATSAGTAGVSIPGFDAGELEESNFLESAILDTKSLGGDDRRSAVTRVTDVGQLPVYVVMSVPPAALSVPLLDALWPELPIVLAISLATLVGAWALGDFLIARKASELAESARRMRRGDFAYVASVPQDKSELGQVGVAFGEMAEQLDTTIAQLQKAVKAKDEFLSLVSHELRTPVTTILGNSQVLVSRWQALASDQRLAAVEDVLNDSQRLKRIIENLLVLARLETGNVMEVEPIIIRRAIKRIVGVHQQQHPARSYNVVLPVELAVVEGNMQCIEQIMDNMLSNAEKYSPPETPITVRMVADETTVTVAVEDQGIGLDPAEAQELFSPFYRSSRTAHYSGVGLGLSVCQRLVEAQGGTISARANDGRGSVFSFTLQITERIAEEPDLEPDSLSTAEDALVPA